MKIQILGPGCSNCEKLAKNAAEACKAKGIDCEIVKVTDIKEIMNFGVMQTPGLAFDGKVKSVGRVLSAADIEKLL
jgi:small redox-active disulfide protein 2